VGSSPTSCCFGSGCSSAGRAGYGGLAFVASRSLFLHLTGAVAEPYFVWDDGVVGSSPTCRKAVAQLVRAHSGGFAFVAPLGEREELLKTGRCRRVALLRLKHQSVPRFSPFRFSILVAAPCRPVARCYSLLYSLYHSSTHWPRPVLTTSVIMFLRRDTTNTIRRRY
jgi:hypothetical protein